jgi:hypothetical protein
MDVKLISRPKEGTKIEDVWEQREQLNKRREEEGDDIM